MLDRGFNRKLPFQWWQVGLFLLSTVIVSSSATSWAQYGPFAELRGTWSGSGKITFDGGRQERISCRATYDVVADGNELQQTLKCAGDTPIDLKGTIVCRGGVLSGTWSESNFRASGELTGRVGAGRFEINVQTGDFDAKLILVTYGNVQSVRISSEKQMKGVEVRLVRADK